jgi:hypothetical protein
MIAVSRHANRIVFDAAAPSIQPAQIEMAANVKIGRSPALTRADEVVEQG